MVTRAKAGIFKPLEHMNCHVTTTSPLPRSHVHALRDPNWKEAMLNEYNALITNGTCVLVPHPVNVNVVRSMWLFKHKFNADGSLSRYKARLVVSGCSQQHGIDCDETFNLVVKPATIRTVLSLAISRDWPIHQLDVKNAFLHGHLSQTVYMHQPPGFVDPNKPDYVCHLQRSFEFAMTDLEEMLGELICKIVIHAEPPLIPTPKLGWMVTLSVCLHMHDPRDPHFTALKRILRYVRGTLDYGLQLHASSTTQLTAYTNADWAGCPVTRRSTSGYCVFLDDNLLSWCAKRQVTFSRLSAEAEYRGVANVVAETAWIRNLLHKLHTLFTATLVSCDNVSAVYMPANSVQHQRTKHIEIDIHFVRDFVASGQVRVLHVPLRFQYADIFTKGLRTALFLEFRSSLNVRRLVAQTAGEY
uniref:Ribonuclease H-like domain-containing protein n=1 Tax=Tanacetum cinerariifolium TaxID=118510 RepID=A0A699H1H5_TANCI|nr:ribonuclease H-like domain-containing protein [Tanacetum cinerariifolium]